MVKDKIKIYKERDKSTGINSIDWLNHLSALNDTPYGIYCFIRKRDTSIVYIGRDARINQGSGARLSTHMAKSHRKKQEINKILQKNPQDYYYQVIARVATRTWMENIEASMIETCKEYGMCKYNYQDEKKETIYEED